jgi:hypothetical protein
MSWLILACFLFCSEFPREPLNTAEKEPDSLTVLVALHDDCVISRFYTPRLNALDSTYRGRHIGIVGFFPHGSITPAAIEAFRDEFRIAFPLLLDENQSVARRYGVTIMPEAVAVDHRTGHVLYRGRIDDSYVRVGKRKLHPRSNDLENVVKAWLDGDRPDGVTETPAVGCFITFTEHD